MTWTAIGESVTGTSHRTRNTPCQDCFRFRMFGESAERLVVVVADGAGSASHSDAGSQRACDEFVSQVEAAEAEILFTREGVMTVFANVHQALHQEAEKLGVRPRDVACTALLAFVTPAAAVFAQIGDGAIVVGHGDERRIVFWPEPGEYANLTNFLTEETFKDFVEFEVTTDPITELAAFTDGLQRLALDYTSRQPFPGFFQPFFRELRNAADVESLLAPLQTFLDSPFVNDRTDDDKTLVLAVKKS